MFMPNAIGSTPRIAVTAVSTTGRARSRQVSMIASYAATPFAPQPIVSVDQHDIVIHDHARIRDHADAGHDHAERLSHHHQADQHADGREDDSGEHQSDRDELVELREQDREDQEHRGAESLHQEGARLGALLVLALEAERDALSEIRFGECSAQAPAAPLRSARPRRGSTTP